MTVDSLTSEMHISERRINYIAQTTTNKPFPGYIKTSTRLLKHALPISAVTFAGFALESAFSAAQQQNVGNAEVHTSEF